MRTFHPKIGSAILALFIGLPALKAQQTAKEHSGSWHSLFNGHDLSGWHTYLKHSPTAAWKVEDGAIELDHSGHAEGGDLVTNREFENFDLKLEWKISKAGNSGIIFEVHESPKFPATYQTGPEMQVLDNKNADDNKEASHLAGSLYDLIAANPKFVHPEGMWNSVRIRLDKGHLQLWMNGHQVVDTHMWTPEWNALVAKSKFNGWKGFAAYHKGHIALQDHGYTVWYRNIRIREL